MDSLNMQGLFAIIANFISFLMSFFLLTVKSKNRLGNILLAVFIMLCSIDVSGIILGQSLTNNKELYEIIKSTSFLIFPFFYFYVLSICYIDFKLKIKFLCHLIPFISYNLIILIAYLFTQNDLMQLKLNNLLLFFNTYILKFQALIYLITIVHELKIYKKIFLENYTYGNIGIYKWLSRIVMVFLVTLPLSTIKDLSYFSYHQKIFSLSVIILTSVALLMLCWFILKALYSPDFFRGVYYDMNTFRRNKNGENKAIELELSSDSLALMEQLRKHMINKQPFLEPKLTLQELALQMGIPARKLSLLINQYSRQHFFDFVNMYRVEKAIEIIEKSEKKEYTIQQIYFEVGFNTKSSFNTAFKKHTGLTPSEFKKSKIIDFSTNNKKMV
ncbi:MAG: hypothetical protein BGO30_01620 [Bacteroidetes bacterium 41-46]|nr:MAG: hypothetical protein BGO30_01620 [Bacteroidetes bacterium 41-46]